MDEETEAPLDALEGDETTEDEEEEGALGDAAWTDRGCSAVSA